MTGGLVATVVMTAVMMVAGDDSPPPTAALWSKYVAGGEPMEHKMPGMALHLLYGVVAGGALAVLLQASGVSVSGSPVTALAAGALYGFLLFVVGAAFWMKAVLGMDPERKQVAMFLLLHLVYGFVLGGWLSYIML